MARRGRRRHRVPAARHPLSDAGSPPDPLELAPGPSRLVGTVLLVAFAVWNGWALLLVPVGVAALLWGALLPEERYLTTVFGGEYESYRTRVRRWL